MNAGKANVLGVLLVLLLAVTVLLVIAIALVHDVQREGIGGEIVWEDFGFRVLGVEAAEQVGPPGDRVEAVGRFRIVRLEVANHAKQVDFRLDAPHVPLSDADGRHYPADPRATRAWRAASASPPVPVSIAPGETCVLELVYDVPEDVRGLTLKIRWGGPLVDLVDDVVFGDRRIELE